MFIRATLRGNTLTKLLNKGVAKTISSGSPTELKELGRSLPEYKLMVIGAKQVGKTNLISQYVNEDTTKNSAMGFMLGSYSAWKKKAKMEEGSEVLLNLQSTRAEELGQFARMGNVDKSIGNAKGFILVFSVKDESSLQEVRRAHAYIQRIRMETQKISKDDRIPIILVANYCDSPADQRKVSTDEGKDAAIAMECPYFEVTGAIGNKSAFEAFNEIIKEVHMVEKAKQEGKKPQVTALVREVRQSRQFRFSRVDTVEIKFAKNVDSSQPQIRAATVEKLVERLTYEKYPDPNFVNTFLLTFRSFMRPCDLLSLLEKRYSLVPPNNLSVGAMEDWVKTVQTPIRLRVFNVLKSWIINHYHDFNSDPHLAKKFRDFAQGKMMNTMKNCAEQLLKALAQRDQSKEREVESSTSNKMPKPIFPKKTVEPGLMDLDALEVARQMTLIDFSLFSAITPEECMGQPWNKPGAATKAPNIIAMINSFNRISSFITSEIVKQEKLKQRALLLKRVIKIGDKLRHLNNFNSVLLILSGLENSAVYRLQKTWTQLPKKYLLIYQELKSIGETRGNYKNLRNLIHTSNPPLIPYPGFYFTDLTFIEDGNDDFTESGLVNFDKRRLMGSVIKEIQQYQQCTYSLAEVPPIKEYLLKAEGMDDEQAYRISLLIEPRESGRTTPKPAQDSPKASLKLARSPSVPTQDSVASPAEEKSADPTGGPTRSRHASSSGLPLPRKSTMIRALEEEARKTLELGKFSSFLEGLAHKLNEEQNPEGESFGNQLVVSEALGLIVEGIISFPPENPAPFLKTFELTIAGDKPFFENIWNGLIGLSKMNYPESLKISLAQFISAHCASQADLTKHQQLLIELEIETERIRKLEQAEGCQSMETNNEIVRTSYEIVTKLQACQQLIREMRLASSGLRKCITFNQDRYNQLLSTVAKLKAEHPSLSWQPVDSFIQMLVEKFVSIAKEDAEFYRTSILESTADIFEGCEAHLDRVHSHMMLLFRRVKKFHELMSAENEMKELGMKNLAVNIHGEVQKEFQQNVGYCRDAIRNLDGIEAVCSSLAETLWTDQHHTATLTQEQQKEGGKLIQLVIKTRSIQQEMESLLPELVQA